MRVFALPTIAAILLLGGCDRAADPPGPVASSTPAATPAGTPVSGPPRRILAFGDSLFAGYGIGLEASYPAQLETALRAKGINARIVNAAVSGETSAAGAQRFAFALDAQDPAPELILLELGGNDMLRGLDPAETRKAFAAMLGEARRRGIKVLVMGMRAPPNYGAEYTTAFDALYGDLAREYGAGLVPFWLESIYQRPELFQADRIHPTRDGIAVLVENTADAVLAALPPPQET